MAFRNSGNPRGQVAFSSPLCGSYVHTSASETQTVQNLVHVCVTTCSCSFVDVCLIHSIKNRELRSTLGSTSQCCIFFLEKTYQLVVLLLYTYS